MVDTQPRSGAATSRTEAVIPVRGWTGLLLPPRLFSLPHLPLLYPASSDEEEWGQHLKRLESSPECPKGLSARKSGLQGSQVSDKAIRASVLDPAFQRSCAENWEEDEEK